MTELYKHLETLNGTPEVREELDYASCFSMHFFRVLKSSQAFILLNALGRAQLQAEKVTLRAVTRVRNFTPIFSLICW